MKHINFLEPKFFGTGEFELNYFYIFLIFGGLIVVFITFGTFQKHTLNRLSVQANALSEEVETIKASKAARDEKEISTEEITNYLNNPISWSSILKQIAQVVPPVVQIKQITGALKDGRVMLISGQSSGFPAIQAFKEGLGTISQCLTLSFVSLEQVLDTRGNEHLVFQIECGLK